MLDALRLLGGFALWCLTLAVALVAVIAIVRFTLDLRRRGESRSAALPTQKPLRS